MTIWFPRPSWKVELEEHVVTTNAVTGNINNAEERMSFLEITNEVLEKEDEKLMTTYSDGNTVVRKTVEKLVMNFLTRFLRVTMFVSCATPKLC